MTRAQPYSWRPVVVGGGGYVTGLIYHPAERNLLYARTDVGGAYRWDAINEKWIGLNASISGLNNQFNLLGVLSLAIDPTDTNRVYLACGQGTNTYNKNAILSSVDRGATWTRYDVTFGIAGNSDGRGTGERLSVNPFNPLQLLMGTSIDGLWKSDDRGVTWTKLTSFNPFPGTPTQVQMNFVLHDPVNSGVIYVGVNNLAGPSLWRSNNGGTTWAAIVGQPTGIMALQAKLNAAGTLYVSYANSPTPNGASAGAVWKIVNAATTTSAASWTNLNLPTGQGGFCGLSLDRQRPGVILVSTIDRWYPRDQIYLSTNDGATWTGILDGAPRDMSSGPWAAGTAASPLDPHWITDVEIDPYNSDRASFVTGYGIFTTNNLNVTAPTLPTWSFTNNGLEEVVPTALFSPASDVPLISTIKDLDGFVHSSLDVAPASRHLPAHGANWQIVGTEAAPDVMLRTHDSDINGSISRNGGSTWTDFSSKPATAANGLGKISLSADGARIVWCPVNSVPYWSANDGATWTASTGVPAGNLVPTGDSVAATDFYVLDPTAHRVSRSTDGGVSFTTVSPALDVKAVSISRVPGRTGEFFVYGDTLSRLSTNGTTLSVISGMTQCTALGFGAASSLSGYPAIYCWATTGAVNGIYRSKDIGVTWTRINDDAHQFGATRCITGDPLIPGRVYFGTSGNGILMGDSPITPLPTTFLYQESLAAGWINTSWATVNFGNTSPVHGGTQSISVTAGGYQAFSISRANTDTTGYSALGFWINGGAAGGQVLKLRAARSGTNQIPRVLPALTANTWTYVTVPLSDLGVFNVSDLTGIIIQNNLGTAIPVFYLDDISLVGYIAPKPTTMIYQDGLSGWSSSSWAAVNFANATPTHSGTASISVVADAYEAFSIYRANMDTAGYASLVFWINGGTSGGQTLKLRAVRNGVNQPSINLTAPAANTWTRVVVPLADLKVDNVTDLSGFIIQNTSGTTLPAFYLDDIALQGN